MSAVSSAAPSPAIPFSAVPSPASMPNFSVTPAASPGVKRQILHGQLLHKPLTRPVGSTGDLAYEVGLCAQLDESHALIIVNIDEQGGGDLCIGTDGFVFSKVEDIREENAIPINRVDPNFVMRNGAPGYLAKFPGPIGFIPLGATLEDGSPHPAAGTGYFLSCCLGKAGKQTPANPEAFSEMIQLRWDGETLTVSPGVLHTELLGLPLRGTSSITAPVPQGASLLQPMGVEDKTAVFRFEYDGNEWAPTEVGEPFVTVPGHPAEVGEEFAICAIEMEPAIQRSGDKYLIYTRGGDSTGRLYESEDGLNYRLKSTRYNHTVPQPLNQGLDGNFYVATNPGPGMIRNPLLAYPMEGDGWGEPFTIYDEGGIRGDDGEKIPFIDHCIASNLFLEGRWRHMAFFRACDLKERTLHAFQINGGADKAIYGDDGPLDEKLPTSGLYLVEFEY